MQQLMQRLTREYGCINITCIHAYKWQQESDIICCEKGICVFVKEQEREEMYKELKGLLITKGVVKHG